MKTKPIPALITLIAGLITCIVSFLNQVSMEKFVKNLCLVVIIFFVLGTVIRFILERNFKEPKEEAEEESQEETEETEEAEADAQPREAVQSRGRETTEENQ